MLSLDEILDRWEHLAPHWRTRLPDAEFTKLLEFLQEASKVPAERVDNAVRREWFQTIHSLLVELPEVCRITVTAQGKLTGNEVTPEQDEPSSGATVIPPMNRFLDILNTTIATSPATNSLKLPSASPENGKKPR